MTGRWRVGIDIGGTFTDIFGVERETGLVRMAKVRTNTTDPLAGLVEALAALELDWDDVADLVHGTTMVTNALVESRLAPVALVATTGFADVLDIARQSRQTLYRLDVPPRRRADVPPERRFEIDGRIAPDGTELEPLSGKDLDGLADRILETGAEAVAIALMHSYANPAHEEAVAERLRNRVPFLSISHQISPEAREYERTATTVVNASVMPMVATYIDRLAGVVPSSARIHLFHSSGGMASPALVRERPLSLALSGPAAGAAGAASVARHLGLENAISFDMGGTTTDVCLIRNGEVEISSDRRIAGRPIRQPIAAIETIGAGGGSIVSLRSGGLFVGPQSAGADPGPACYGFGGTRPTIADADLVLGYLDRDRPLGGTIRLDAEAAEAALEPVAGALSHDVAETAIGVARVAHATMARAVRRVSVERGVDARDCALIAFGGAGPMHACGLADETGMDTIVIPSGSGGFSALGCVTARMSYAHQRTLRLASATWCAKSFAALREEIAGVAREPLVAMGLSDGDVVLEEIALVRYAGQSGTVPVPLDGGAGRDDIDARFHAIHEELYGYATGEDWILESYRINAQAAAAQSLTQLGAEDGPAVEMAPVDCRFPGHGACRTPRIWRASLEAGRTIEGPLLIVDDWSTTVVAPNFSVRADTLGTLIMERLERR